MVVTNLTGSNTTNIIFQAFPTIRPAIPKPTNDVLPFLIGGGGGQTLAVQYSFLLTSNSWANLTNVVIPSNTNSTTLVVSNVSAAPYIFLRVGTP
jgi:hypothetical protein